MKLVLIAALSLVTAAPVITIPAPADAQVHVGRGVRRSPPRRPAAPRPRLTEAEQDRMFAAQDEIVAIDTQRAAIISAGEAAGGLTEDQRLTVEELDVRRAAAQQVYDQLQAKLNG